MIRVISSFADGPVNFHSTGPAEDQIQKLISSTGNRLHKGPSIFNFTSLFLTGTHWFWTETHDFSQDESKDSM